MSGAISEVLTAEITDEELARLLRVGYMSPQDPSFKGEGFACNNCDWFRRYTIGLPSRALKIMRLTGKCNHSSVNQLTEAAGCCNLYTYHGVHT